LEERLKIFLTVLLTALILSMHIDEGRLLTCWNVVAGLTPHLYEVIAIMIV